ncbi:hypothetical protein N0V85_002396 [Neurospora sp. IMI 360204]|nr:hypothetical protein N0V85_002396 [Neurospora sp. IMI 360204]
MNYFDIHDIITGDEQAPAKTTSKEDQKRFKRKQVLAYTILSNNIQPFITKLQALGYNDEKHALDPWSLYNAVIEAPSPEGDDVGGDDASDGWGAGGDAGDNAGGDGWGAGN